MGQRAIAANGVRLFYCSLLHAMTGMHALHMVIGVGLLMLVLIPFAWRRRARFTQRVATTPVEGIVGLYWHFVDIVWIFLFPLLYLLGLS